LARRHSQADPGGVSSIGVNDGLIEPIGLIDGHNAAAAVDAGAALWLAGGPLAFSLVRIDGRIVPVDRVPAHLQPPLTRLTMPAPSWAGLAHKRPQVMGILNVTPDSFSDGGDFLDMDRAVAAGLAMVEAGADLVDVGGETTRPGSHPTGVAEEMARVVPVIRTLARAGVVVSVDTRNAATMRAALDAGARIVNDVSALTHDPHALGLVAARGCPVVLMHMRHDPASMTDLARYDDVALEVVRELGARVGAAMAAGIPRDHIAIDPGVGFAKTPEHNLQLLPRLPLLLNLGCPILAGVSRKRFVGELSGVAEPRRRVAGSIAAGLHAVAHGASLLRVHDVAETVQAVRVWRGLTGFG
jgi:dihydropteroate synthase